MFYSLGSVIPDYDRFILFPTLVPSNLNLFRISYSNLDTVGKGIYCYLRFNFFTDNDVDGKWYAIYPKAENDRLLINSYSPTVENIGIEIIKYARYNRKGIENLRVNLDVFDQPIEICQGLSQQNLADIETIIANQLANNPTLVDNQTQLLEQFDTGNAEILSGQQVINNSITELNETLQENQGILNVGNNFNTLLNS